MKNLLAAIAAFLLSTPSQAIDLRWEINQFDPSPTNLGSSGTGPFTCAGGIFGNYRFTEAVGQPFIFGSLVSADLTICGQAYNGTNLFFEAETVSTRPIGSPIDPNVFSVSFTFANFASNAIFTGTLPGQNNVWTEFTPRTSYSRFGAFVPPSPAPVSVPASAALLGVGILGLLYSKKKSAFRAKRIAI
jgi:hypothetical protein